MDDAELKRQLISLTGQVADAFLRIEALRAVLHESGILAPSAFEDKLAQLKQEWMADLQKALIDNLQDEKREIIRTLLEKPEGTKQ
jgi:hypothetical protein